MAAAAPIAPQEQGEVEKPLGAIRASSHCSHLLMVLSDWDWHWAPAAGVSGGSGAGCRCEQARRQQQVQVLGRTTALTNKKPTQASITKVKQFEGSTSFVRRSQWMLEQLRQVNGIDPNRDSAEFDLLFENAFDQWVASTASEKCTFFQILHHTCQRYLTDRKPEFINCQSKIMGGNSILHSAADSVSSAVQKASQALNERGERLGRAEEKTEDLKNSAQQFAETAHKLKSRMPGPSRIHTWMCQRLDSNRQFYKSQVPLENITYEPLSYDIASQLLCHSEVTQKEEK
ncbi:Syntaxin-binding protein 6 [Myotis brandtii]|uniref:Syntaxin-binding protein 6 n=1 Tax=Myotis brandtii TaxID=109478 RepID=S7MFI9_MYOBR|nr:Syntaxin-binding protein 6 [Myotis brandtii]